MSSNAKQCVPTSARWLSAVSAPSSGCSGATTMCVAPKSCRQQAHKLALKFACVRFCASKAGHGSNDKLNGCVRLQSSACIVIHAVSPRVCAPHRVGPRGVHLQLCIRWEAAAGAALQGEPDARALQHIEDARLLTAHAGIYRVNNVSSHWGPLTNAQPRHAVAW